MLFRCSFTVILLVSRWYVSYNLSTVTRKYVLFLAVGEFRPCETETESDVTESVTASVCWMCSSSCLFCYFTDDRLCIVPACLPINCFLSMCPTLSVTLSVSLSVCLSVCQREHCRRQLYGAHGRSISNNFFQLILQLHKVWQRLCVVSSANMCILWLQLRLHEPCSVDYFGVISSVRESCSRVRRSVTWAALTDVRDYWTRVSQWINERRWPDKTSQHVTRPHTTRQDLRRTSSRRRDVHVVWLLSTPSTHFSLNVLKYFSRKLVSCGVRWVSTEWSRDTVHRWNPWPSLLAVDPVTRPDPVVERW